MCGIAGTTVPGSLGTAHVDRLLQAMRTRGPDGAGTSTGPFGSIGMCRLRIRGPISDVPFRLEGSEACSAYNGEIYAVRCTDGTYAVPANGPAEAELVLHGASNMDGMFAAAHAKSDAAMITLDRDPFGIKPLFYRTQPHSVSFASELSPLIAETRAGADLSVASLAQYLLFGRILGRRLPYDGVHEVLPGERLELGAGTARRVHLHEHAPGTGLDGLGLADHLRNAVARCMVGDRSMGIAVSGGIDSTVIAGLVAETGTRDVQTFSVLVEDTNDGIHRLSELPSGAYDARWQHVAVKFGPQDLVDRLAGSVRRYGQPFRMSSMLLYEALADAIARANCTVLLTGEGADEMLLGYQSYLNVLNEEPSVATPLALRRFYLESAQAKRVMTLLPKADQAVVEQVFSQWVARFENIRLVDGLREAEREVSLEPLLLRNDVTMMARSIEARTPYLHGGVPDYCSRLPQDQLIGSGLTKRALRESFPRYTQGRAKTAFRAPLAVWFHGELRGWLAMQAAPVRRNLVAHGFDANGLSELFRVAGYGDEAAASVAFSCIVLHEWLKVNT